MTKSEKIALCARIAHEANKAYCDSIGDHSQKHWDEAPEWARQSAIKGVLGVLKGNTPEQSHESWLAEKVATGWRYGKDKDAVKKTHPAMVPYAKLPKFQKVKNHIFVGTVRATAYAIGLLRHR